MLPFQFLLARAGKTNLNLNKPDTIFFILLGSLVDYPVAEHLSANIIFD